MGKKENNSGLMNEAKARKILGNAIEEDNRLTGQYWWLVDGGDICLDGDFTLEQLEAIVWWMKNMEIKNK